MEKPITNGSGSRILSEEDFSPTGARDKKSLDALMMVLLHDSRETLLPELYDIFGKEVLIKFLDIFGGRTVKVPAREYLRRAARDVDIYIMLFYDEASVDTAARRYDLSQERVRKIFCKMQGLAQSLGV